MKKLLLFVVLAPLGACGGIDVEEPSCDVDRQAPAVAITVVDAVETGPLAVESLATVTAGGRTFQKVVPPNTPEAVEFAAEQQGTYDARVEAEGYQTWDTAGLVVRFGDECTVETADLTALMEPAEG